MSRPWTHFVVLKDFTIIHRGERLNVFKVNCSCGHVEPQQGYYSSMELAVAAKQKHETLNCKLVAH